MKHHKIVGSVSNLDLQPVGNYVYILVKRESEEDSPLIVGQFISLVCNKNEEKIYLGRIESFRPDLDPSLNYQAALKNVHGQERGMDEPYKDQTLFISYRARILGVCEDKNEQIKFFSNVRSLPSMTSLEAAIPSADFMTRLFKSAVAESDDGKLTAFEIGHLKYGTVADYTNKFYDSSKPVPVLFNAANLLRKRTAILGKSGYGKSNAVKTVIGMMATKFPDCGQLILDTNGEYALENDQNDGFMDIFYEAGIKGRIVLYTGRKIHAAKKEKFGKECFKPLRFDVFENISASVDIILSNLAGATIPMYIQSWIQEAQGVENQSELFSTIKNKGIIWGLWFKTCLDAGMTPVNKNTSICDLVISKKYLDSYILPSLADEGVKLVYKPSNEGSLSFDNLEDQLKKQIIQSLGLVEKGGQMVTRSIEMMAQYADWYANEIRNREKKKKDGDEMSMSDQKDSSIKGYIELLNYYRRLYQLKAYNLGQLNENERTGARSVSLGESVWQDLKDKKIVIIDLASVPGNIAKSLSEQIAAALLNKASQMFGDSEQQEAFRNLDVLVFIEEAQNYLSSEQVKSGTGIYERLAKEGRKFHLGLVYVTQQPSAIDEKITSQTENIIALHMSNNTDTMILNRIKDKFDEITCKFIKDEAEKGLAYLYAEPHQPFVLPAQIHRFDKELILKNLKNNKK